jgi:hypothetical protein
VYIGVRETGNIEHRRHRTKTNNTKHETTQEIKKDEQNGPYKKSEVNPCAREGLTVAASYKTSAMLLIVKT